MPGLLPSNLVRTSNLVLTLFTHIDKIHREIHKKSGKRIQLDYNIIIHYAKDTINSV